MQIGTGELGEWGELAIWALGLATLTMAGWGRFADQEGIRRCRERMQGDILAIRLFQNDLGLFLRLHWRSLRDACFYLLKGVRPTLVLALPMGLCLIQLDGRYGMRPLRPGEAALVEVRVSDAALLQPGAVVLEGGGGMGVETAGVRDLSEKRIAWRIRAREPGRHWLTVRAGGGEVAQEVTVGPARRLVAAGRTGEGWTELLLQPGARPLDPAAGIVRIAVDYPKREFVLWGWQATWSVPFLALFLIFGYMLKRLWKVEV